MTTINRTAAIALASLLASACTMHSQPMIVDGDRAAGKVISTTGPTTLQPQDIDWTENGVEAARRCLEWGYTSAQAFEGVTTHMVGHDPWWGSPILAVFTRLPMHDRSKAKLACLCRRNSE